eukprot:TRINITY_DN174_c2_g3_i1.p1 TRINITY_DN174_c2_g3~~TRINITY_DN174_c2_g3_i1.p1  ORF type:complete len:379 (-),score=186.20 TRINITY_DN174_c2_g3_i1:3-1139(-)
MISDDSLTNQPVVIDNGSGILKAGLAGSEQPKCVFPSFVGRIKHKRVMPGAIEGENFVGSRAEEQRGLLKISYPIEHGIVTNWNDMELIWRHTFTELNCSSKEHPVLLTEAPLNPRTNREKAAEIFFETLNVPALYFSLQAVLSLYASGRTTGVVLDSGDGVTHAVPIYQGFAMPQTIMRIDVAGRDVTENLQLQLRRAGYIFRTSAEKEIVRAIKEATCFVTLDPSKDESGIIERNNPDLLYKLPDGQVINLGPERFRAPEILFNPELIGEEYVGVHQCLTNSIQRTDIDMRRQLYSNIVLSGGSTMFPGFGERLLQEVKNLAPRDTKIKISAPPERKFSTWIGGSILANLPTFKKMAVSRREWEEDRVNVIHRKTF